MKNLLDKLIKLMRDYPRLKNTKSYWIRATEFSKHKQKTHK